MKFSSRECSQTHTATVGDRVVPRAREVEGGEGAMKD